MIVQKGDTAWLIADALRSGNSYSRVEKIHRAFGGLLLKFGNETAIGLDYSTDADVQEAISRSSSLRDFQQNVSEVLALRAEDALEVAYGRRFPGEYLTTRRGFHRLYLEQQIVNVYTGGLAFLGVSSGHLVLIDWHPEIVQEKTPEGRYKIVVRVGKWQERPSNGFFLYPFTLSLSERDKNNVFSKPEDLPYFLDAMERQTPCHAAGPNVFLRVKISRQLSHQSSDLREEQLQIEELSGHLSDSWNSTPISKPPACP